MGRWTEVCTQRMGEGWPVLKAAERLRSSERCEHKDDHCATDNFDKRSPYGVPLQKLDYKVWGKLCG